MTVPRRTRGKAAKSLKLIASSIPLGILSRRGGYQGRRRDPRRFGCEWRKFGDTVTPLIPRLIKGALVYCEGRITLGTWTDRDGQAKSGLNLSAWEVVPMAQIGRQRPRPKPRSRDERDAAPFDDAIPF